MGTEAGGGVLLQVGRDPVEEEGEQQGAGGAALFDSDGGGEGWGGASGSGDLGMGLVVHGADSVKEVWGDIELLAQDFPEGLTGDLIVGLLEVNKGHCNWSSAGSGRLEEVGEWELVVLQAVAGAEASLFWGSPWGVGGVCQGVKAGQHEQGVELGHGVEDGDGAVGGGVAGGVLTLPEGGDRGGEPLGREALGGKGLEPGC